MPSFVAHLVRSRARVVPILSTITLLALAGCGSGGGGGSAGAGGGGPVTPAPITDSPASPTISGTPATSVMAGQTYTFTPQASDPNGDRLTFQVDNLPTWATFDAATGRLSGTPTAANVGTYAGVTISVSDGRSRASLPAFTIGVAAVSIGSATLSWTAPTARTDSTPLTDLSGYRIYYGNSPGIYSNVVNVPTAGVTTYVIENLTGGTWHFAVAAVDSTGVESRLSSPATKTIS